MKDINNEIDKKVKTLLDTIRLVNKVDSLQSSNDNLSILLTISLIANIWLMWSLYSVFTVTN